MAIVLAGFLGAPGRNVPQTPEEYQEGLYQFGDEAEPRKGKFFSIPLREFLNANNRAPKRWLIMGTEKSIWDALYEAVPEPQRTQDQQFNDQKIKVGEALRQSSVNPKTLQKTLDDWGRAVGQLLGIEVICCLIGNAEKAEEQPKVWNAIEQHIQDGDDVIFDITHSLRHFPVIATFSLMLLRQLRDVKKVDFYYGAFELKGDSTIAPVVHVPICQQLSDATQAVSTHTLTGDFRALGLCLDVPGDFNKKVSKVAHDDELNRPNVRLANQLLDNLKYGRSFLARALAPRLRRSLQWVAGEGLDRQYRHKAQSAFDCGQYFKAIAYLYEALLMAQMYFENEDPTDLLSHDARELARKDLKRRRTYDGLFRGGDVNLALDTFFQIEYLRNAVLHGTLSEGQPQSPNVEKAIEHKSVLIVMLQNGFILFDALSNIPSTSGQPSHLRPLPEP